jgi:hypothetical protein
MRATGEQRGHGVLQRRVPERADGGGRGGGEEGEGERRQRQGGDAWGPARQGSRRPAGARQGPGRVHPGPVTRNFSRISPSLKEDSLCMAFSFFPFPFPPFPRRSISLPYETHHRRLPPSCTRTGLCFFDENPLGASGVWCVVVVSFFFL